MTCYDLNPWFNDLIKTTKIHYGLSDQIIHFTEPRKKTVYLFRIGRLSKMNEENKFNPEKFITIFQRKERHEQIN